MAEKSPDTYSKEKVTYAVERLVKNWLNDQATLQQAVAQQQRSTDELKKSADALAQYLLPADVKPGEQIGVWYGDSLILATKTEAGEFTCRVRTAGRAINLGG